MNNIDIDITIDTIYLIEFQFHMVARVIYVTKIKDRSKSPSSSSFSHLAPPKLKLRRKRLYKVVLS